MSKSNAVRSTSQQERKGNWRDLAVLCQKVHDRLYARKDRAAAKRLLPRLDRLLKDLPRSNLAIIRQEGLALVAELRGKTKVAMKHRKREIVLMKMLFADVARHSYAPSTKAYILEDRDKTVLRVRLEIVKSLQKRINS